jgi:ribosomal protein S12 methylthiotransferase accessory factor
MKPKPLKLKQAIKKFTHDQDKIIRPEQTVSRFKQRLMDNHLDILEDVVRIDNGRLDIPVYFSVCGPQARDIIGNYKQMGKGATPDQAQASAVMELGERFSLFSFVKNDANFIFGPQRTLTDLSMDFNYIVQSVSDTTKTTETTEDIEALKTFFEDLPMQWTWAHDLTHEQRLLLPFTWFWTINEFNGSSAGNCNEEALCQGICEVVERHVCASISRNQTPVPQIDQSSIHDLVAQELITKFEKAGVELYLSDFTFEMGIPSVGALAWDPSTFPKQSEIVWTAGTMPSANKALCRALTEVAQLAGDFNSGGNYVASGLPKFTHMDQAQYITHPGKSTTLDGLPELGNADIRIEVDGCVSALADRGMDVFAVDVAHPELQVPAFYTIIPGAQFRERATHCSVGMIMAKIITQSYSPDLALTLLERLRHTIEPQYYLAFYEGQILLEREDYQNAIQRLTVALDMNPPIEDRAAILTYLGLCHKEQEQFDQALTFLNQAYQLDGERTDTLNLMGFCYFKRKEHEKAIDHFKKLISLDPSSAIDYANIGVNYREMGEKAMAIEYYQLALELDPGIDFARNHLHELGVTLDV